MDRRHCRTRTRARCARAVVGVVVALAGLGAVDSASAGAATDGTWRVTTTPSNVRAVHATLLKTGKVLLIAGSGNDRTAFGAGTFTTSIWDPATGNLTSVHPVGRVLCRPCRPGRRAGAGRRRNHGVPRTGDE